MKVEKGHPVPVNNFTAILKSMDIGDSVFDENQNADSSKIYMAARKMKARYKMSYTARKVEGGLRIWRIA